MKDIAEKIRRSLNDLEIERDLARYFAEDGEMSAATECFRSAQLITREIEALFILLARIRTSPAAV